MFQELDPWTLKLHFSIGDALSHSILEQESEKKIKLKRE
jgi:hypothetical protein